MKKLFLIPILFVCTSVYAMQKISIVNVDGVNRPERPFPENKTRVVCDGSKYIVYEPGDTLPADPDSEQPKGEFLNRKIYHARDVKQAIAEEIATIFAAPTDSGDKVADQLKLVCDILALLCAKEGWVAYPQAGIQGVSGEAQAVTYINDNFVLILSEIL